MSETTTVVAIIARARRRSDSETATPTVAFVTDVELLDELNQAYKELLDYIMDCSEASIELLAKSATLTTPYALPADFYRALTLDVPSSGDGTNPWREAPMFNFRARNRYTSTDFPAWRIVAGALVFAPANSAPSSVRLWYLGTLTEVLAGGSLATFNGWDKFLVGRLVEYILTKQESDASPGKSLVEDAMRRIATACARLVQENSAPAVRIEFMPEDSYDWSWFRGGV